VSPPSPPPLELTLLDQDHPDFRRQGRGNRTLAVHAILRATLEHAARFAVQMDRARLREALGAADFDALFPGLDASTTPPQLYDRYEGPLSGEQRRTLRRALSPAIVDPRTGLLPLTAIRSARARDADGRTLLRIGDGGGVILFALPERASRELLAELDAAKIPTGVLTGVSIDVEALEP
jgi:hypothetical protein